MCSAKNFDVQLHGLQQSCMQCLISFTLKDHQEDISAIDYGDRKKGNMTCHIDRVNT